MLLAGVAPAFCQTTQSVFSALQTEVNTARNSIKPIMIAVIVIITIVYIGINLAKYFKGDRESSQELIKIVIGIVAAAVLLTLVNTAFGA